MIRQPLTSDQKILAISLYLSGTTSYVDIANEMGVRYNAINAFMTKWKKRQGILKTRGNKKTRPKVRVIHDDNDLLGPSQKSKEQELKLLRYFYKKYLDLKKAS